MQAEKGKRYAQVIDGKLHWIFDASTLPEWKDDAFQVVDITGMDQAKEGDVLDGSAFKRPTVPLVTPKKSEAQRMVEAIIDEPEALAALIAAVGEGKAVKSQKA